MLDIAPLAMFIVILSVKRNVSHLKNQQSRIPTENIYFSKMASNIERMTENDTNNVASSINAKSLVEDVVDKKKIALGDIKNKIDPNSNQNQNKSDNKNGKIEKLIGESSSSGTNDIIYFVNDRISGMPVDYETVWSIEWINPVYENVHKWMKILEKAKMEPERDEIKPINDNSEVLEIMEAPEPEIGIEELTPPVISDSDKNAQDREHMYNQENVQRCHI